MRRRNINLRVVRDGKKEKVNHSYTDEQHQVQQELMQMVSLHRIRSRRKAMIGCAIVAIVIIAAVVVVNLQTYTHVRVSDTYQINNASDNNYEEFADGVLKYSRDGIAYLNRKGEVQWNQSCQMKSPVIEVKNGVAAIADKGGNDIIVLETEGVKGEIRTTLPIERIAVSEQGIVAAILKNESTPKIICYDTAGNVLVEHKASLAGIGYPLDLSLSSDGMVLQVVYLSVQDAKMVSRVCYYNFGEAGESKEDHQVAEKEYDGSALGAGFYMNDSVSAVVGEHGITIFEGKNVPKEKVTISLDKEIQSVFYSEKYIGLVLKAEGTGSYELCLYNTSGKKVLTEELSETYKAGKISGNQVILYDGKNCSIFTRTGIHRFEGQMDNQILEIFPTSGVNKYIVINANGMENVRLVK